MHNERNYKQDEKASLRMAENNSRWNNGQRMNLKNILSSCSSISEKRTTQSKSGKNTKTDISLKKTYRWLINTWKDAKHQSLLEKCKWKSQWGIIWQQSEWPSSKSLQTINAGRGVEKREPSYNVGGNANWNSHYGEPCGDNLKNW